MTIEMGSFAGLLLLGEAIVGGMLGDVPALLAIGALLLLVAPQGEQGAGRGRNGARRPGAVESGT